MLFRNAGNIHLLLPSLKLTAKYPKVGRLYICSFLHGPILLRGYVVSLKECTPGIVNVKGYIKGQTPLNLAMNHLPPPNLPDLMPQIIEFLENLDFHQYIPSSHTKKQAKKNHQTLGIVNLGFF